MSKLYIYKSESIERLGRIEGEEWVKSQKDNTKEGSYVGAYLAYEKQKHSVNENDTVAEIYGNNKRVYIVKGNGEIKIKS